MTSLFLLALLAQLPPNHTGDMQGSTISGTAAGDIYTNGNEVCATNETTDAAPDSLILKSGDSWAQGTQTASNLYLAGGSDEKKITVTNTAISANDTIIQTVNGAALAALVDGTAWTACLGETTTVCADRIATAIQAQSGSGVVCDNVAAVVYCQPVSCSTYAWSSASADGAADGAAWTSSNGTDGQVLVPRGVAAAPGLSVFGDLSTGLYRVTVGTLGLASSGNLKYTFGSNSLVLAGPNITSSFGMLDLGGAITSTHALDATVGSVGISGALEADADAFFDDRIAIKNTALADGDATPDVSGGSMWTTPANTAPTVITDLDLPTPGQIVMICIGSATNPSTIADAGNFNLSAAWNPGIDDCITLYVQADNDYIELNRADN